jgi:hypothetical protein
MNGENVITGPPSIVKIWEAEVSPWAGGATPVTVIKYDPGGVPDLTSNVPATVPSLASLQTGDNTGVPERVQASGGATPSPLKPEPDTEICPPAEPELGERTILATTANVIHAAVLPLVVPTRPKDE